MKGDGLFATRFAGYAMASVTYLPSATFGYASELLPTHLPPAARLVQLVRLR
jgi:hypothetical protein